MIKTRSFLLFKLLSKLPLVKDYEFGKNYSNFNSQKFISKSNKVTLLNDQGLKKINYASGGNYLQGWINVDFHRRNSFLLSSST